MKIIDTIYRFPSGIHVLKSGICRVRVFINKEFKIFTLLTDLGSKGVGSITNSVEYLCASLIEKGIPSEKCTFIEHYESTDFRNSTFDLISFSKSGVPSWTPISRESLEILVECESFELTEPTLSQSRLLTEIDRIRNEIDPFMDFSYQEPPEIVKRRLDIESKMIEKTKLLQLIKNNAGEQALQQLIKTDLSLFAEIYAIPQNEYICFSEFPLDTGFIDFVIFSGRSRMDVTLVEIKGADFYLLNQDHYEKYSSKIQEAISQIETRYNYIYRNYPVFCKNAHVYRENAEKGKIKSNFLVGPQPILQVDPNKDINIRFVIIGGRTKDDYKESQKRHTSEIRSSVSLNIESWDSWIRKLQRR